MAGDYKEELLKLLGKLRPEAPPAAKGPKPPGAPPKATNAAPASKHPPGANVSLQAEAPRHFRPAAPVSQSATPPQPHAPSPKGSRPSFEITLGVDFGTRFTKVAAFLRQTNQYKVLAIGPDASQFSRSWIVTDASENAYPPDLTPALAKGSIEYLKMHLANPASITFGGNVRLGGKPLQQVIEPLCALYLAGVLRRAMVNARHAFSLNDGSLDKIDWFANVGVPVQYCDGKELHRFQRVANVAWSWKNDPPTALGVTELLGRYEKQSAQFRDSSESPIQVVPELAAALAHFVERRTTAEGMYAFFDIGGGTLDGTAFHLLRTKQGNRLNILSAAVDDVGTMAVARRAVANFYLDMNALVETPLIFGSAQPKLDLPASDIGRKVQALFNKVVRQAKSRMPALDFSELDRPKLKSLAGPGDYPAYPVFVAGGGARSEWYADLFKRTRKDFAQHQVGIGECDVKLVPAPNGFSGDDYPRFVVAIGLTADSVQFDSYRLPSSSSPAPALAPYVPPIESPYSKDYV